MTDYRFATTTLRDRKRRSKIMWLKYVNNDKPWYLENNSVNCEQT